MDQSGRSDSGAGPGLEHGDERDLAWNAGAPSAELHRHQSESSDNDHLQRDRLPPAKGFYPTARPSRRSFIRGTQPLAAPVQRPNCNFGSLTDIFSGVNSNYQGLVAQISHRFSNHLQFNANYTWSHALDFGQNNQTATVANNLLDPQNIRAEYGNSITNIPNRLVINAVVTAPWKFTGWKSYLLNDYEVSPSLQVQSGLPYSIGTSGGFTSTGPGFTSSGGSIAGFGGVNGSNGTFRMPGFERTWLAAAKDDRGGSASVQTLQRGGTGKAGIPRREPSTSRTIRT